MASSKPKTYHGASAIAQVEAREGRLSPLERRIVELEGFVDGDYLDTKGITTSGVGQTGKYRNMSVKDSIKAHIDDTRKLIPKFDSLSPMLQQELVQANYRGDLRMSPKARKHMNKGEWDKAAAEWLDHEEYKNTSHSQIKGRIKAVSDALAREGSFQSQVKTPTPKSPDMFQSIGTPMQTINSFTPSAGFQPVGVQQQQQPKQPVKDFFSGVMDFLGGLA